MAKVNVLCASVFVFLSIYLRISAASTLDGHYFYEIQPETYLGDISLKLLGDGESHHLQKRSQLIGPSMSDGPTSVRNDTVTKTNKTVSYDKDLQLNTKVAISPTGSTLSFPSIKKEINPTPLPPEKIPPQIFPLNSTRIKPDKDILLGVNGTGQRKYYPPSQPTVIPSTYPPLLHDIPKNKTGKPNMDDFVDNISISKFSEKEFNSTLAQHNITNETIVESYYYYNSTFITDPEVFKHYWIDLSAFENATTHELLSSAHRRAATVTLSFEFPFYGHLIKNVTMATGGFLYTGDYLHAWLAATQYIAPLMANFDTSLSNDSFVRYVDNGTAFTVLWEKVALKDKANEGVFTFQATLHKNGDIVFAYQNVPPIIGSIKDDQHPVKVGLSDAYIIDSIIYLIRRKTIYEYHRVNFRREDIRNGTVIHLKALPTCLDQTDCESCLTKDIPSFQCLWCPSLKRCSSGVDRYRQSWLLKGCDKRKVKNETYCSKASDYDTSDDGNPAYIHDIYDHGVLVNMSGTSTSYFKNTNVVEAKHSERMGMSGILAIMLLVSMIVGITMWISYAFRNPHTTSGQLLIRYRPSQWRWRRGEARYTAATIHM